MNPQHRHRADAHTDTQPNLPRIDPPPDGPRHSPPSSGRVGAGPLAPVRRLLQVGRNGRYNRAGVIAALVAVIVVALVVAVVSYRSAVNSGEQGSNAAGGAAHHVTYKATSSGKTVIVTYTQGDNGLDGQTTAPSPWTIDTSTTANVAVLTVTTDNDVRSVSCAIVDTKTGNTLVSKSVPPSTGATVTCVSGSLSA
ncbi:MAG TPA: hypothetical protein VGE11_01695 [Pseudonocardia sp.]